MNVQLLLEKIKARNKLAEELLGNKIDEKITSFNNLVNTEGITYNKDGSITLSMDVKLRKEK